MAASLCLTGPAAGQELQSFEVATLDVVREGSRFTVAMSFRLGFDPLLETAMVGGLVVPVSAELRFIERRAFWFDRSVREYSWRASVRKQQPGTDYAVRNFGSGSERTAVNLADALASLETLTLDFDDAELLDLLCADRGMLQARIEIGLDELPETMQISILTNTDWNFSSGWVLFPAAKLGC